MTDLNQAICYHEHGDPFDVLSLANIPLENLGPREVRIELQAATIHPSDFGLIQGSYGKLRSYLLLPEEKGLVKLLKSDRCQRRGVE